MSIFNYLSLADFASPYLNAFSRNYTSNLHIKINIYIAGIFSALDELLADSIWYPFGKESKLSAIIYDGVAPAGVAVPGL